MQLDRLGPPRNHDLDSLLRRPAGVFSESPRGLHVTVQPAPCGAIVHGIDLSTPLSADQTVGLRSLRLAHQVLAFPDQPMTVSDLERFATSVGPFGPDPYFEAIPGHPHVAQVRREADEISSIFADTWHSDWSFLADAPAATLLYGDVIPPMGGDTLFANQYDAWAALPASMKQLLRDRQGVHSARRGCSRAGRYSESDKGRSMAICYDDSALSTQLRPIARKHPETGRAVLYVSPGHTIGIDGMPDVEAAVLLQELFSHQAKPEFIYRHRWCQGMLVMWDNRCLVHAVTGGYQGHHRLPHRITLGEQSAAPRRRDRTAEGLSVAAACAQGRAAGP